MAFRIEFKYVWNMATVATNKFQNYVIDNTGAKT